MAKRQYSMGAALLAAGLTITPAIAQDTDTTCSNAGNVYKVGEFACIAACHGARRLAQCKQASYGTTWTYVSDVCPSAHLVPPPPANASQIPTIAAMTPLPGPLKISEIGPELSLRLALARIESQKPAAR
jgi:hypothetical protein